MSSIHSSLVPTRVGVAEDLNIPLMTSHLLLWACSMEVTTTQYTIFMYATTSGSEIISREDFQGAAGRSAVLCLQVTLVTR